MFGSHYRAMRRYMAEDPEILMPKDATEIYRGVVGSVEGNRLTPGHGTLYQMVFVGDGYIFAVMANKLNGDFSQSGGYGFGLPCINGPFGSRLSLQCAEGPGEIGEMLKRLRWNHFSHLQFKPSIEMQDGDMEDYRRAMKRGPHVSSRLTQDHRNVRERATQRAAAAR